MNYFSKFSNLLNIFGEKQLLRKKKHYLYVSNQRFKAKKYKKSAIYMHYIYTVMLSCQGSVLFAIPDIVYRFTNCQQKTRVCESPENILNCL